MEEKRPVGYNKTTCHFFKTTRRFQQNDPSVSTKRPVGFPKDFLQLNAHLIDGAPQSFVIKMQNTNYFLSHSRAYARITGVLSFLLSQVSHFSLKTLIINIFPWILRFISSSSRFHYFTRRIISFKTSWAPLPSFLIDCDTCDSKKTTSLLEGVRTCAYTRTHEKTRTYARNIRCA